MDNIENTRIVIVQAMGCAYWLDPSDNGTLMYAPMMVGGSADFSDASEVDWDNLELDLYLLLESVHDLLLAVNAYHDKNGEHLVAEMLDAA